MKVLRKKVREPWEVVCVDNTLEALQREVGGYIETLGITCDSCLIVNEEGLISHLPFNTRLFGQFLFGTFILFVLFGDIKLLMGEHAAFLIVPHGLGKKPPAKAERGVVFKA